MDAVLFYPCLEDETISLCLFRLLQSRFFCLFVCLFLVVNLFFLLLLCLLTGLDHQGIFRLSGSTTEINDMKQLFENGMKPNGLCCEQFLYCYITFFSVCPDNVYIKTFNPLVTASEWRRNRIFHQFACLACMFVFPIQVLGNLTLCLFINYA